MNRLKLLAAVALLGIPLAACEEATPPPPVGSITGTVSIEGTGVDGVSVNLSNGNSTTTAGGGNYRFDNVEGGAYTVTISGFPSDATFDATSAAATISSAGQSVTVNFSGAYIRTASVMGTVTVENMGLPGVTVTLTGVSGATATTDDSGQYAFTGLRMGSYSVEISGFDNDEVGFSNTAASVSVGVGESKIVSFDGTYLRTAGIMGRVSVEGEGLEGVTVSLAGGPDNTDMTTMTDAAGQYSFAKLRAGDYAVGISGYDTDDYEFELTSQNVTVALGETANVPFEGVLLRTSGISGRVSVEGMGLDSITVTLSMADAEDMTTMTDVGGLYAFAGLAAGDYTVAIAVESEAYVFESMSMDVTVGDDETAIVNFEGMHARTASVTVKLFVDELMKNNMMDDGEMAFPSAEMIQMVAAMGLPLPLDQIVSLVGPGINDMQSGMTMADGSVVFSGLMAGDYKVVVTDIPANVLAGLPPALAHVLRDYAYGGPATGYDVELGVGEAAMQYAPVDITHTTVNVAVTLKGGEARGMGVVGATVDLYADAAGDTKIGSGTTEANEDGHAVTSIRFARAGTTGNTVHMGVSTDDYFVDPTAGMQAVMWDPMSTVHPAPDAMPPAVLNDANILNLVANFSFGGATISTDHPESGKPLGGWAVSVMSGDDAVEGAPTELDEHGGAEVTDMVMPTDLPKTYMIAVDTVQTGKDDDGYRLDGGENYTADPLVYVHTGLMLAGEDAADAGTIEVTYTTQTLKVYVHQELDQVMGYSANVQGGDERMSGLVDVEIRYASNGTRRQFTQDDSIKSSSKAGVYTFSNVPADMDVVAIATEAYQDKDADDYQPVMVLDPDEVSAYSDVEANGIMGGAFGDMGGFHHTVQLCPLMSRETDQRFRDDNCGTFGFVETYHVTGQVWKNVVTKRSDDFALGSNREVAVTKSGVPGFTVNMDPVDGENLAMESADPPFEARRASNLTFDFGQMPAGVYTVSISGDEDHWNVRRGPVDDPTDDLDERINPLDSILNIDVAPKTGYVYGAVTDAEGKRAAGVVVSVNGVEVETDDQGRYIAEGFLSASYRFPNATRATRNRTVVRAFDPGKGSMEVVTATRGSAVSAFAANTPYRVDFSVSAAADIATVSGSVTHSSGGDGVGGVEILVDGDPPLNATLVRVPDPTRSTGFREVPKLLTDDDGSYTARITATGGTVTISAQKDYMFFTPEEHTVSAVKGADVSGINFSAFDNGTISGRVVDGDGDPLSGVIVSATEVGESAAAHADTTGATGSYVLRVPYGRYNVEADRDGYTFSMLEDIAVPNDGTAQDDIEGTVEMDNANLHYLHLSDVTLCRTTTGTCTSATRGFRSGTMAYTATVGNDVDITTVTAEAAVHGADVDIDPGDDSSAGGHQVDLFEGDNEITVTVTALDGTTEEEYTITVTRRTETTTIEGTITDSEGEGISAVFISVGRTILNPNFSSGRYRTNSAGEFSVQVESGGAATVTPSKTGYTFDPASREVTLVANSTITGVDFEGGTNATITGRVTAGGVGLRDATVSVSPRDGGGTARTATTRASGRFTVSNVSVGWNTVTVTKEGYTFPSRDVHVGSGTVDIGDLEAMGTIQATNVEAERATDATTGAFTGSVTVTWAAGAADTMGVAYQVQSCVPNANADPAVTCEEASTSWAALGSPEDAGASDFTVTESNPAASDNGFLVRVQSTHATLDDLNSAAVEVGEIDASPSAATATRDIDPSPDNLVVEWDGDRAANTATRIIGGFTSNGTTTWVVLSTIDFTAGGYSAADGDGDHQWTFAFEGTTPLTGIAVVNPETGVAIDGPDAGTDPDTMDLTAAMMDGAFMVRVQARQPSVDFEDAEGGTDGTEDAGEETWRSSGSASVTAKQ